MLPAFVVWPAYSDHFNLPTQLHNNQDGYDIGIVEHYLIIIIHLWPFGQEMFDAAKLHQSLRYLLESTITMCCLTCCSSWWFSVIAIFMGWSSVQRPE